MVHLNKLMLLLADFRAHTQVTILLTVCLFRNSVGSPFYLLMYRKFVTTIGKGFYVALIVILRILIIKGFEL